MRKLLPLVLAIVILVLSHLPTGALPGFGVHYRATHALAYASLAVACLFATARQRALVRVLVTLGIVMAVGAMDEFTQPLFGRKCNVSDWLTDLAGAGMVLAVWLTFRACRSQRTVSLAGPGRSGEGDNASSS